MLTGWFKGLDKILGKTVTGRGMCVCVCVGIHYYCCHRCIEENGR